MSDSTTIQQLEHQINAEKLLQKETRIAFLKAIGLGRNYNRRYHLMRHKLVRAMVLIRTLKAENAELRLNGSSGTLGPTTGPGSVT